MDKKYWVVTPYYKEDRGLLERCMASVRRQSVAATHVLVADGFPQDWIDAEPVRHIKLDRAHGDYGNCARGMAGLMAVAEGADAICFLDADNWYDDDHIEQCLMAAALNPRAACVAARRRFVRPDGSVMETINPAEYPAAEHVDTNCMFMLPPGYQFLQRWCLMPRELSGSGDHLIFLLMTMSGVKPVPMDRPTVNYQCMFEHIYRQLGEAPPAQAKPVLDWAVEQAWINALPPDKLAAVRSLVGLELPQLPLSQFGATG